MDKVEFIKFENDVLYWKGVENADTYVVTLDINISGDPVTRAPINPIYVHKKTNVDLSSYLTKYRSDAGIYITVSAIDSNGEYCSSSNNYQQIE